MLDLKYWSRNLKIYCWKIRIGGWLTIITPWADTVAQSFSYFGRKWPASIKRIFTIKHRFFIRMLSICLISLILFFQMNMVDSGKFWFKLLVLWDKLHCKNKEQRNTKCNLKLTFQKQQWSCQLLLPYCYWWLGWCYFAYYPDKVIRFWFANTFSIDSAYEISLVVFLWCWFAAIKMICLLLMLT